MKRLRADLGWNTRVHVLSKKSAWPLSHLWPLFRKLIWLRQMCWKILHIMLL